MGNKLKNIILFITGIAIAISLGEMGLRFTGLVKPVQSGWRWDNSPLRQLQPESSKTEVNQLGIRGQRIHYDDDDYVILLLGDSQVEAAAVSFQDMPENVLERNLKSKGIKSKVFSLASSGWGQDQQLIALEEYFLKWRADYVLIFATPLNDYWENAFPDRSTFKSAGHIKPTYLYDGVLKGPFYDTDFYLYNSAIVQLLYMTLTGNQPNADVLERWLAKINKFADDSQKIEYHCDGLENIKNTFLYKEIYSLNQEKRIYSVETNEDVENSRSHFSPFTSPSGKFDSYEKEITKILYSKIKNTASNNNAKFSAFYPVRNDFDKRNALIDCIRSQDKNYKYSNDYLGLLKTTLDPSDLIYFDIDGMNNIVVSKDDRHLNRLGIEKVFSTLSDAIYKSYKMDSK